MFSNLLQIYTQLSSNNICIYEEYRKICECCTNIKIEIKRKNSAIYKYKKQNKMLTTKLDQLYREYNKLLSKYHKLKNIENDDEFEIL
jgi:hypothetical protein